LPLSRTISARVCPKPKPSIFSPKLKKISNKSHSNFRQKIKMGWVDITSSDTQSELDIEDKKCFNFTQPQLFQGHQGKGRPLSKEKHRTSTRIIQNEAVMYLEDLGLHTIDAKKVSIVDMNQESQKSKSQEESTRGVSGYTEDTDQDAPVSYVFLVFKIVEWGSKKMWAFWKWAFQTLRYNSTRLDYSRIMFYSCAMALISILFKIRQGRKSVWETAY
jgi:hypothetical protein